MLEDGFDRYLKIHENERRLINKRTSIIIKQIDEISDDAHFLSNLNHEFLTSASSTSLFDAARTMKLAKKINIVSKRMPIKYKAISVNIAKLAKEMK